MCEQNPNCFTIVYENDYWESYFIEIIKLSPYFENKAIWRIKNLFRDD